ncbi:hypothetical protein [Rathayibacter rathayi]|uniref:hypothetical protein n=2 Tax=Rathayibacter rathayi TaxID=33887 RepID=UPI0011AFD414|nr:hypothetical protein [Rathayibacter rathayi]
MEGNTPMKLFRLSDRRRDGYAAALAHLADRSPRETFYADLFAKHACRAREATTLGEIRQVCRAVLSSYGLKDWGVDSQCVLRPDGSLDAEATNELGEHAENVRQRSQLIWWLM